MAQRRLRELQGANPDARLLAPDAKTLARFVNNAVADTGINVAGLRGERRLDVTTWLKRMGLTDMMRKLSGRGAVGRGSRSD